MYHKQLYVFQQTKPVPVTIRNYTKADFDALICLQQQCFPPPFPSELWWNISQLTNHTTLFPEGALCIEVDGQLAGSMTALLTDIHDTYHTWAEVTDDGYITTHNPDGKTLYIVDLCVSPHFRNLGIGKWLMLAMYDVVVHHGLERLLGGCRMPGYSRYAHELSAEQYVQAVMLGDIQDAVLSFLLRCGRMPLHVIPNYLEDEESHNYGVLMEWKNPFK